MRDFEFDVFISHASEDKTSFAEPLAVELRRWGLEVWFDKFTLKVGDSLRESIETGLSRSRYGIVIFSEFFVSKFWTRAELNGLFSRESEGKKVILPVWHEISAARMRAVLPIQADKVALLSSDGAKAVARSLIEVVRPDLLEVGTKKRLAFDAGSSLLDVAKEKHPGWGFTFHHGATDVPVKPGTVATVTDGPNRIDMSVFDPARMAEIPKFSIGFSDEGLSKLDLFHRTGKSQSWAPGELRSIGGNIPFMPETEEASALTMTATPNLDYLPTIHIRLEIGETVFPFMEMKFVRDGTDEKEVVIRSDNASLELQLVFSTDGTRIVEPSFAWNFDGHRLSECRKAIQAIDGVRKGEEVRIVNLDSDTKSLDMPLLSGQIVDDPFPESIRSAVFLGAQIQDAFKVDLRFKAETSETDLEALTYLDCLLNGTAFGNNVRIGGLSLVKEAEGVGASQRLILSGEPGALFLNSTNFPGHFALWSTEVRTPAWGLYTEKCFARDASIDVAAFDQAEVGTPFSLSVEGKTPTYVRWADDKTVLTAKGLV